MITLVLLWATLSAAGTLVLQHHLQRLEQRRNYFPEPLPDGYDPPVDPPPGHDDLGGLRFAAESLYGSFVVPAYLTNMMLGIDDDETPEEAAERAEQRRQRQIRKREAWATYETALIALDALDDPVSRKVLDLHRPTQLEWPRCQGCDMNGYEAEEADWPCSTVQAIAEIHGIKLPESHYLWSKPTAEEA